MMDRAQRVNLGQRGGLHLLLQRLQQWLGMMLMPSLLGTQPLGTYLGQEGGHRCLLRLRQVVMVVLLLLLPRAPSALVGLCAGLPAQPLRCAHVAQGALAQELHLCRASFLGRRVARHLRLRALPRATSRANATHPLRPGCCSCSRSYCCAGSGYSGFRCLQSHSCSCSCSCCCCSCCCCLQPQPGRTPCPPTPL